MNARLVLADPFFALRKGNRGAAGPYLPGMEDIRGG